MTSTAPLAKLGSSVLLASVITSATYIFFLAIPGIDWYWWFGFALFVLPPVGALLAARGKSYMARPGHRYPVVSAPPSRKPIAAIGRVPVADRWPA